MRRIEAWAANEMNHHTANFVTGDPAFAVDRRGEIVLWNRAAETALGYPASATLGQHCWKLLSGKDSYANQYCCERCPLREMAFNRQGVNSFHMNLKTAAEGFRNYAISCLIVHDGNGNDLLLHICRLDNGAQELSNGNVNGNGHGVSNGNGNGNGNGHAKTLPSANGHRGALTQRELEVLALLAEGTDTTKIASMMCISSSTARNHIQHILYKLNVHNRLEAVVLGKRLDLI